MFKITSEEKNFILKYRVESSDVLKKIKSILKKSSIPAAKFGHSSIRGHKPLASYGYILRIQKLGGKPQSVTVKIPECPNYRKWVDYLDDAFDNADLDYDLEDGEFEFWL